MIPTFNATPFSAGAWTVDKAGETDLRMACAVRQPRRTWLYVAAWEEDEENVRDEEIVIDLS